MQDEIDFSKYILRVCERLCGKPNAKLSKLNDLRYGTNGSLSIQAGKGTWYDHERKIGGGVLDLIADKTGLSNGQAVDWIKSEIGVPEERRASARIVAKYDYCDEHGELLFQVCRFEPKTFRQRRPVEGGWEWSVKGVRPVPYRLPELVRHPNAMVFVVEGEKDADRLIAHHMLATCNAGGAGKWHRGFAALLQGRDVVVLPDNDDAGRAHAQDVVRSLVGVAARVRVLELPGLPEKGDVSDWLDGDGDLEWLMRLVENTAAVEAPETKVEPDPQSIYGFRLIRFADMQPHLGDGYLIKQLLGSTGMTVIYGEAGTGKTFFALYMGLCIAAGSEFFGRRTRQGAVLYIAAEAGRSIENRVAAARQELEYPEAMPFAAITSPIDLCSNAADMTRLTELIHNTDFGMPLSLIVIDTLSRVLAGGNENAPDDMGAFVRNIDTLRDATGAAIAIVHHSGKDVARGARGHSLLRAATDTEIEVSRDEGSSTPVARVTKQRDFPTDGSFCFTIVPVALGEDADGDPITSCVVEETEYKNDYEEKPQRLTGVSAIALRMLHLAIERGGITPPSNNYIPSNTRCVDEQLWRKFCYEGGISAGEQKAKEKAFGRAHDQLIGSGMVRQWNGLVWPG